MKIEQCPPPLPAAGPHIKLRVTVNIRLSKGGDCSDPAAYCYAFTQGTQDEDGTLYLIRAREYGLSFKAVAEGAFAVSFEAPVGAPPGYPSAFIGGRPGTDGCPAQHDPTAFKNVVVTGSEVAVTRIKGSRSADQAYSLNLWATCRKSTIVQICIDPKIINR